MLASRLAAVSIAICCAQLAQAQGRLEFQVSPAGAENWTSSINATPGQSIDIRVRVSYTGTQSPFGLGSVYFQPAISNWDNAGASTDALLAFVNQGGAGTTPLGDVPDQPGVYGRVAPYGWRAPLNGSSPNPYTGFYNIGGGGLGYLRVAQATCTAWVGQPGNTTGGGGVNVGQPNAAYIDANPGYPHPFNSGVSDLVVLKLGITLSNDAIARSLSVGAAEGFAGQAPTVETMVKWFSSADDTIPGSITGAAVYQTASINIVPTPWSLAAVGALALRRRRR